MSSPERRAQKRREWEEQTARREAERNRIANLSMYARIEEFVEDEQLKTILHAITQRLGMEDE